MDFSRRKVAVAAGTSQEREMVLLVGEDFVAEMVGGFGGVVSMVRVLLVPGEETLPKLSIAESL